MVDSGGGSEFEKLMIFKCAIDKEHNDLIKAVLEQLSLVEEYN